MANASHVEPAAQPIRGAGRAIDADLVIVIPAALHGNRMPRKMLRTLHDRPLLRHAIETAMRLVPSLDQIVALTDDDEVSLWVERRGCRVHEAPSGIDSSVHRDRAVYDAVVRLECGRGKPFDAVLVLDPSAPLLDPADLETAVTAVLSGDFDSVISATEEKRKTWTAPTGTDRAIFEGLPHAPSEHRRFIEINGFVASRRGAVQPGQLVGPRIGLSVVHRERAVEITSSHEWWICERLLRRRRITFVVAGNRQVGMGHIYRTLQLAHHINNHEVVIVCTRASNLARDTFVANGYTTVLQGDETLEETVLAQLPDVVINDFLDTDEGYIGALKRAGAAVINFEDLGAGADHADLVFNDLYQEVSSKPNHRVGPEYFCTRDEFFEVTPQAFRTRVEEVLITFGGVDEDDLTSRVLEVIWPEAERRGINLSIVIGPGYAHGARLRTRLASIDSPLVKCTNGTKRMSEYMARADMAFSSAGRTLFELSTMRVPAIVMACNAREAIHPFASSHEGFRYLGRHDEVSDGEVVRAFCELVDRPDRRRSMRARLERFDFRNGTKRVLEEMTGVLAFPLN